MSDVQGGSFIKGFTQAQQGDAAERNSFTAQRNADTALRRVQDEDNRATIARNVKQGDVFLAQAEKLTRAVQLIENDPKSRGKDLTATKQIAREAANTAAKFYAAAGFSPEAIQARTGTGALDLGAQAATLVPAAQAAATAGATAQAQAEVAGAPETIAAKAAQEGATAKARATALKPFKAEEEATKFQNQLKLEEFKAGLKGEDETSVKEKFKQTKNLRDEFTKASIEFVDVRNSFARIQAAASDPSAAGDIAIIFSFMKMLDPRSTVREGEFATAQNSGNVPSRVVAQYNRLVNGERLESGQRADFLGRAEDLFTAANRFQTQNVQRHRELATKQNLDPDLVTNDLSKGLASGPTFKEGDVSRNTSNKPISFSGITVPPGKTAVFRNGKWILQK